jgi:hypothetical protein
MDKEAKETSLAHAFNYGCAGVLCSARIPIVVTPSPLSLIPQTHHLFVIVLVEHQAKLNSDALQCYSCRTLVYLHESIDCSFIFLRAAPEDSTPLLCNRP